MKIMITSLTGGTGKTVLAYNIAKRFTKPLLVDLTENQHLSVIFNMPMLASGYQTFQAGHKNLDELVVRSDAISFLPRGLQGVVESESLNGLMEIQGFDAVIVDTQLPFSKISELSPLFDIIVIPMRCDVSVKAENWLLSTLSNALKEKSSSSVIVPVILRNRVLDAKISITTKVDERKISKNFPVSANIIREVFTVENDPEVHDKTWQNRTVEGKYGSVISAMVRRFIELTKETKVKRSG